MSELAEQVKALKADRKKFYAMIDVIDRELAEVADLVTRADHDLSPQEAPRTVKKRGRRAKATQEVENPPQGNVEPQG